MTLGEGKKKVYELIDEYSSGGTITADADIENKMADFFDIAQKQIARIQRIIKVSTITPVTGQTEYPMPNDFDGVYRIWCGGKVRNGRYQWKGGKIIIPDGETIDLEYFAIPATVDSTTADSYAFEVKEDACQAMCFYVAAQQLIVDLVVDYGALLQLYQNQLATISTALPGGIQMRNTFWR